MTNEYNPDGKEIRFIDSHYKDLFHIPDGSCVQIHYPDEMVVKPCTFIDEYHTQIGYNVFHICQFAEIMERNGASYMPEPELWAMKPHGRSERIESLRCRPAKMVTTTPCWMKTTTRLMAVRLITLNCPCSKSAGIFWNPSGWSAGNCGQCSMRMSWSRLLKSADRRWWSMTLSLSLLLTRPFCRELRPL